MSPNGRVRTISDLELYDRYTAGGVSYRQLGAEAGICGARVRDLVMRVIRRKKLRISSWETQGFDVRAIWAMHDEGFTEESSFEEIKAHVGWPARPNFGYKTARNMCDVMGGWDVPWMQSKKTFDNEAKRLQKLSRGPVDPRPRRPVEIVHDADGRVVSIGYVNRWDPKVYRP